MPRAFLLLLCVLLAGCRAGETGLGKPPDDGSRPNLILITVDTLRADHMGMYGYGRDTMPGVEAWARDAVVFDNAVTPRGITRPSYASMLTGLDPHHNGVRTNATVLHADNRTLAEVLGEHGYHTAAFVSNFLMLAELSGFAQGFELYDDELEDRIHGPMAIERTGEHTYRAIRAWLEDGPPEPFFLFVNLFDPHGPYTPPDYALEKFRSEERRPLDIDDIPRYQRIEGVTDYHAYVDRYDGEIYHTDQVLSRLLEDLEEKGYAENSVVVFTADHGESLGEHGDFFDHHRYLYEPTVHVPLVIRMPGGSREGLREDRVRTAVTHADLMPTLLEAAGLPAPKDLDGRSLLPLLRGEEFSDRDVWLEWPHESSDFLDHLDWFAVRHAEAVLVDRYDPDTGRLRTREFYDLREDPEQMSPWSPDPADPLHALLIRRMEARLEELRAFRLPFPLTMYKVPSDKKEAFLEERDQVGEVKELDDEQIQRLKSLGYIR